MSKYLTKRYTWLGIIAVAVCALSHFNLISQVTSMYIVGVAFGWVWGYDYCKERMEQILDVVCKSCCCGDCQEEESSNNNSEEK